MEGFIHNIIDPNVNIVGECFKLLLSMFLGANELHSKGASSHSHSPTRSTTETESNKTPFTTENPPRMGWTSVYLLRLITCREPCSKH